MPYSYYGYFFGEMPLVTNEPHAANIRALDYCELFILYKETFEHIMEKYPRFYEKIQEIVGNRVK